VGDPSSLEVVMDVLTTLAVAVQPGQRVALMRWGGLAVEGRVRRVEPSAFETKSALGVEERRVNVIVVPTGLPADAPVGDGFRIEGRIETWSSDGVVRVPKSALFRDPQGWAAIAVEEGRARLRRPVIGREGEREAQVLSGLDEGDVLVAYPTEEVREGVRLKQRAP
jgi:HlyD family secretion protein